MSSSSTSSIAPAMELDMDMIDIPLETLSRRGLVRHSDNMAGVGGGGGEGLGGVVGVGQSRSMSPISDSTAATKDNNYPLGHHQTALRPTTATSVTSRTHTPTSESDFDTKFSDDDDDDDLGAGGGGGKHHHHQEEEEEEASPAVLPFHPHDNSFFMNLQMNSSDSDEENWDSSLMDKVMSASLESLTASPQKRRRLPRSSSSSSSAHPPHTPSATVTATAGSRSHKDHVGLGSGSGSAGVVKARSSSSGGGGGGGAVVGGGGGVGSDSVTLKNRSVDLVARLKSASLSIASGSSFILASDLNTNTTSNTTSATSKAKEGMGSKGLLSPLIGQNVLAKFQEDEEDENFDELLPSLTPSKAGGGAAGGGGGSSRVGHRKEKVDKTESFESACMTSADTHEWRPAGRGSSTALPSSSSSHHLLLRTHSSEKKVSATTLAPHGSSGSLSKHSLRKVGTKESLETLSSGSSEEDFDDLDLDDEPQGLANRLREKLEALGKESNGSGVGAGGGGGGAGGGGGGRGRLSIY